MTPGERFELAAAVEQLEAEAWAQLNDSANEEFRERTGIAIHRVGTTVSIVAPHSRFLSVNRVLGLGCPDRAAEAQVDEILELYRVAGVEKCLIQLSPLAVPEAIRQWLEARSGYTIVPTVKLVRRLSADENISRVDLAIRAVEPSEARRFEEIVGPRLGVPAGLEPGISSMIGRPGWRYYFVLEGGVPVAGGASFVRGEHVWLGLAATCEAHRRRGAQTSLLARRLDDAARAGCRWASADTSVPSVEKPNQSLVNMLRMGFEVLYERVNVVIPL